MSLEADNDRLRARLADFVQEATRNEAILKRLHGFELKLLACRGLAELLELLLQAAPQELQVDAVSLSLFDPEGVLRELLAGHADSVAERSPNLRFVDDAANLHALSGGPGAAQTGPLTPSCAPLFSETGLRSAARLNLERHGVLIGSLHIASRDPRRFTADMATDYVERLAAIIAVCLDNAVQHEQLRRLSLIDVLTKAHNRRSFDRELERELNRACRERSTLSCLMLDLDHFKSVNDLHGHQTGDRALRVLAHAIRQELRQTDLLARYGGEEFAVLLPNTDPVSAFHIAERIRRRTAATPIYLDKGSLMMTISVGLASWHPDEATSILPPQLPHKLLDAADKALYQAKALGRDRVCSQPPAGEQLSPV
ncbi:MAG: sensor domain-containing diguanylate cyclase [Gammaproteobacteria bacterium]|nr:sensor domain-containing diguanylate cyclase [Gammaproteobacteria bacterium]